MKIHKKKNKSKPEWKKVAKWKKVGGKISPSDFHGKILPLIYERLSEDISKANDKKFLKEIEDAIKDLEQNSRPRNSGNKKDDERTANRNQESSSRG